LRRGASFFLRGAGAAEVLGAAAEPWLGACTPEALAPDFQQLRVSLRSATRFIGGRADADDRAYLIVGLHDGSQQEHLIGRFVTVGTALRMLEPPSGPLSVVAE
jgi:hypothetical protein